MQTSDPDIYAAGDCTEKLHLAKGQPCLVPLGSVANKEGRVAGSNAVGRSETFGGVLATVALKVFDWSVGRTGMTMKEALEAGHRAVSATVTEPDRPHYYPGAMPIILKLVANADSGKLLGVQGVGPGEVMKRIDVAVTALTAGMTVKQVADLDLAYAPPFSEAMDVLIHAANTLSNKLDGDLRGVTAPELREARQSDPAPFLLDVRTPDEYDTLRIAGSKLIPLGALRGRASEVPTEGRVIVYCKTSLRAWEASRILWGLGYRNVEVLDGGITAWPYEAESGV
jgi:rhodanese-related sulfurtransferase